MDGCHALSGCDADVRITTQVRRYLCVRFASLTISTTRLEGVSDRMTEDESRDDWVERLEQETGGG